MKIARHIAVSMVAATLSLHGCSPSPEAQAVGVDGQSGDQAVPAIERYRTALLGVTASQQALALETAKFNEGTWLQVAKRSLDVAHELHGRIEGLKAFDAVAPAAAALQVEVDRLQRELRRMDASTWQDVLPDLALITESIQSGMDELNDLAAPEPDEEPHHDHHLGGA